MKFFVYEPKDDVPDVYDDVNDWAEAMKKGATAAEQFRIEVVRSCFNNGVEKMTLGNAKMYVMEATPAFVHPL